MDFRDRQVFNAMQVEIDMWKSAAEKLVCALEEFNYACGYWIVDSVSAQPLIDLVKIDPGEIPVTDMDLSDPQFGAH